VAGRGTGWRPLHPGCRGDVVSDRIWTPVELIRWTAGYLAEKGLDEPRLNAELLLAGVLGVKRLDLYLQFDRPLTPEELAEFKSRLRRRLKHEPLQYIAGSTEFRHLTLRVDRRVLIPRPETELLVGEVLAWAVGREQADLVDVGTGSGAIALSLRREGTFRRVVATDASEEAIALAAENATATGLRESVEFRLGDGLAAVAGERFHAIVSNPPYIRDDERESLAPEVREWEPPVALFSGSDGLDLIRRLIVEAPDHLHPGGLLAFEVGAEQGSAVAALIRQAERFDEPLVRKDLAGRERIVLAELR
jgi:release factor glutamine methyltransferase